jgi:hypothetical protein
MIKIGHIGWRMVALVAFAGTAVLTVTLSHAPGIANAGPACPASGLQAWVGFGGGVAAAGPRATQTSQGIKTAVDTYYTLEFTNVSDHSCRLYGYPEVAAFTDAQVKPGQAQVQVGRAAVRDTSVRPQSVILAPGATAHSVLRVAQTGSQASAACSEVTAEELHVTLPDQGRPAFKPVRVPACADRGQAVLSVQAIQARPGIPGYTLP